MADTRHRALSINPNTMEPRDVSRWVATLGGAATQFSQIFLKKRINGFGLMGLSEEDLKGMGVRSRTARKKILLGTERMKAVTMNFTEGADEFDFVDVVKQWGNYSYYFNDYADVCELIAEFSGLDIPFPGSDFRKIRRGDCVNYYKIKEIVGRGAFGTVHRIIDKKSNKVCAAKMIKLGKGSKARRVKANIMKEIDVMKVCKHENVIHFIEYFSTQDRLSLILEFLGGKNLLERLLDQDGFSEAQALGFFKQMAFAVSYLHEIDTVHRDVKLDNFLLQNWSNDARIVLADFGLSQRLRRDDVLSHPCGTLGYTAPEVVQGKVYSPNCDVWSLGICLFIMLAGFPPFEGDNETELRDLIIAGEYSMEGREWSKVTEKAKDLVQDLLTYDHETRCSAHDVTGHPWVQSKGGEGGRGERARFSGSVSSATFNSKTDEALGLGAIKE